MGFFNDFLYEWVDFTMPKTVRIKDSRLGCAFYGSILLLILFILGYQVIWSNGHFEKFDVRGSVRLTVQQPTRGPDGKPCNPKQHDCKDAWSTIGQLPYCKSFLGEHQAERVKTCKFYDQFEIVPDGMMKSPIFIPTTIETIAESMECEADEDRCEKKWKSHSQESIARFVADIERYTLLINSNFARKDTVGNSRSVAGNINVCQKVTGKGDVSIAYAHGPFKSLALKRGESAGKPMKYQAAGEGSCPGKEGYELISRPIRCMDPAESCKDNTFSKPCCKKETQAKQQYGDEVLLHEDREKGIDPNELIIYTIDQGDVISIGSLLKIVGISLDDMNDITPSRSYRETGLIIEIAVKYNNLIPVYSSFRPTPVEYTYSVNLHKVDQLKKVDYSIHQPPDFPNSRLLDSSHGILVFSTVTGQFGYFDLAFLGLVLAGSLALVDIVQFAVEMMSRFLLPQSAAYYKACVTVITREWALLNVDKRREKIKEREEGLRKRSEESGEFIEEPATSLHENRFVEGTLRIHSERSRGVNRDAPEINGDSEEGPEVDGDSLSGGSLPPLPHSPTTPIHLRFLYDV